MLLRRRDDRKDRERVRANAPQTPIPASCAERAVVAVTNRGALDLLAAELGCEGANAVPWWRLRYQHA